jgi:hypothetical protein
MSVDVVIVERVGQTSVFRLIGFEEDPEYADSTGKPFRSVTEIIESDTAVLGITGVARHWASCVPSNLRVELPEGMPGLNDGVTRLETKLYKILEWRLTRAVSGATHEELRWALQAVVDMFTEHRDSDDPDMDIIGDLGSQVKSIEALLAKGVA